jgi:serine/threonine-protein kinase
VIERCLSKDPAARFQSAAELREALRQSLRGEADSVDVDIDACEPGGTPGLAHPPALPQVVGSYALGPALGRGAMGHVFQARHLTLDRRVALKVLRPELARSRVEVDRFIQEAQAVNRNPPTSTSWRSRRASTRRCPAASGAWCWSWSCSRAARSERRWPRGRLPLRRALRVMRQVRAGPRRRAPRGRRSTGTSSPTNVFLVPRGAPTSSRCSTSGWPICVGQGLDMVDGVPVVVGTPSPHGPRADLRPAHRSPHRRLRAGRGALTGCSPGRLPFGRPAGSDDPGDRPRGAAPAAGADAVRRPIPDALRALVAACLEKDPVRRPQTMAEVGTVLEGLLAVEPAVPRAVKPSPAPPHRARAVAGGLAGLLVIAGTALAGRAPAPTPAPAGPPPEPEEATAGPPAPAPFSLCDSSEWNPQPAVPPGAAESRRRPPCTLRSAPASTAGDWAGEPAAQAWRRALRGR